MNAKEVKSLLKEAREALRKKDYTEALQFAENILRVDTDNYNALVFTGAAAQELNDHEKAENAFRKAIRNVPSQILAWQGWCAFCEKSTNPKHKNELMTVYEKLIELHSDADKQYDVMGKLAQLYMENKDINKTIQLLEKQSKLATGNKIKEKQVLEAMIKVLLSVDILSEHLGQRLMNSLEKIQTLDELDLDSKKKYSLEYMKLLLKENDDVRAMIEAKKWLELEEDFVFPREIVCNLYVKSVVDKKDFEIKNMDTFIEKLLEIESNNHAAKMAQIAFYFVSNKKDSLATNLVQIDSANSVDECLLLMECFHCIHQYENAIKFAKRGLKLNESQTIMKKEAFKIGLIKIELDIGKVDDIKKNISELQDFVTNHKSDEILSLLVRSHLKLGFIDAANEVCCTNSWTDTHLPEAYLGVIAKKQNDIETAKEKLESSLKFYSKDSYFLLELALLLRETKDYSKSLLYILNALKEDPYNPELFVQIGHHYRLVNDVAKAQRCYKKAFSINPNNETAAKCLSDIYTQTGQMDENLNLLTHVASSTVGCKWVLVRLGLHYYKLNDLTAAIKSLQGALNVDTKDSHCWESLADCYFARGSFTAALKSYARALELNPSSIYCCYQLAKIKQLLQDYSGAIEDYGNILSQDPNYIPALKGYGEVKLLQARFYLQECLIGLAKDCNEKAIQVLCSVVVIESNFVCLWKLLGDACTFVANFPPESCSFSIPTDFAKNSQIESEKLNERQLLELGTRCYGKALSLCERPELWHDVGINYYKRALISEFENEKNDLFENSLTALKKAVTLNSKNTIYWNALGVSAARVKNYTLAQHSFIKAINTDENSTVAWTNLGLIYVLNENIALAHKSFAMAQAIDPCYINCWIGMAAIAEHVDHSEAMDLFRHTTSLGNHTESALGYSDWVVRTLLQRSTDKNTKLYEYWMENMSAIPTATDCMMRYTSIITNDSQAFNMLGLLLEKQKLFRSAKTVFEKSLALEVDVKKLDMIRSNYARVLASLHEYTSAVSQFIMVKEPDFTSQCGLALCYYKSGSFTDSYQAYEAAIHWFDKSEEDKSHVYVAMAAVAYRLNEIDNVKALLLESSQLQPPSVRGILGLYALGLLQSDFVLVEAALKELFPFLKHQMWMKDIIFLLAATALLQGKNILAQRIVSKALHEFPWHQNLWAMISRVVVQYPQANSMMADKCSMSAVVLAQNRLKTDDIPVQEMALLVNLSHLSIGCVSKCMKSAQKAVHLYPSDTSNWCGLVGSAVVADGSYKLTCDRKWFLELLRYFSLKGHDEDDLKLKCWLQWYRCLSLLILGNLNEASDVLKRADGWKSESAISTVLVLQWLVDNVNKQPQSIDVTQLQQCVQKDPSFVFAWQIFVNYCIMLERYSDVEELLLHWAKLAQSEGSLSGVLAAVLILFNFALERYQLSKEKNWLEIADNFAGEVIKVKSQIAVFLVARLSHHKGNKKKMKKHIDLLLKNTDDNYQFLTTIAEKCQQ